MMVEQEVVPRNIGFITDTIAAGSQVTIITDTSHLLGEGLITQLIYEEVIQGQASSQTTAYPLLI